MTVIASKKLLHFNLMIVGPNGIGKASFVNALFDQVIIPKRKPRLFCKEKDDLEAYVPITFTPYKVEREEYGRKVSIRVIDTVDFGESLNNTQGIEEMKEYIERQHQAILEEECKVERSPNILDGRIHALIYFLTPSLSTDPKRKALKELDLVLMKTLAARVNIIPVIGKSDVFTKSELATFKAKVMAEIREHQIPIYYFASDESAAAVNDLVPFGLVSCEEKFLGSKEKRLRQLPHGEVHCDHPDHSDSCKLRLALLGTSFEDLVESTKELYEKYRVELLSQKI